MQDASKGILSGRRGPGEPVEGQSAPGAPPVQASDSALQLPAAADAPPSAKSSNVTNIHNAPTEEFVALTPRQYDDRKAMFKPLAGGPSEPARSTGGDLALSASMPGSPEAARVGVPVTGPPQKIGRIRIEKQIGQGSMGVVYLGHDELMDLPVAVKLMRLDLVHSASPQNLAARFLREARLAVRLNHPNMVRLYDAGEFGQSIYLSYELVDGGSLEDLLAKSPSRRLPYGRAVKIVRDVLQALGEAARVGIVHRDVKPANVLLTASGQAKLADLGLAKGLFAGEATVTQPTMVVGTPAYMAPEQAIAGRKVDIRADLYAVGVTLFQAVTGRLPFGGSTAMEVLMEHQRTPPPNPCDEQPEIPPALGGIILRLLAKNPDERYQTPEEVIADLDRLTAPVVTEEAGGVPSLLVATGLRSDAAGLVAPAAGPAPPFASLQPPWLAIWPWVLLGAVATLIVLSVVLWAGWGRDGTTVRPVGAPAVSSQP